MKTAFLLPLFALGLLTTSCVFDAPTTAQAATQTEQATTSRSDASAADAKTTTASAALAIPQYESPRGGQIVRHTGFTLSYDADFKTPQWVGWVLTRKKAEGTVARADNFVPDPLVRGKQAVTKDYSGSGYDRGHIAPAGDMKWSKQAMEESFYLSNICPQNRNLNRGDWKELEELEREWAIKYGTVVITAGPHYTSKRPERIGNNKVAVPDGFFKAILRGTGKQRRAYAFYFKNEAGSRPLKAYQLSVDELEAKTGIDFFPALPDDVERELEAKVESL